MGIKEALSSYILKRDRKSVALNLFSDQSKVNLCSVVKSADLDEMIALSIDDFEIDSLLKTPLLERYWDSVWLNLNGVYRFPQHTIHSLDQIKSEWLLNKYNTSIPHNLATLKKAAELGGFRALEKFAQETLKLRPIHSNIEAIKQMIALIKTSIDKHLNAGAVLFVNVICEIIASNQFDESQNQLVHGWCEEAREAIFLADELNSHFSTPLYNAYGASKSEKIQTLYDDEAFLDEKGHYSIETLHALYQKAIMKKNYLMAVYETADPRFYEYEERHQQETMHDSLSF